MSQYYDPWVHAIELCVTRISQFIGLSLVLGIFVWWAWMHFYFDADFWTVTKQVIRGHMAVLRAFFTMCFVSSALSTGWLFSWLMTNKSKSRENHHRGARMENK